MTTNGRPKANRAQIVTAISEVLIGVMACTGVWSLRHGLSVEKEQNAENAIARLYPLDINLNQELAKRPKAREALESDPDGSVYPGLSEEDKSVFEEACSSLGGVFEYYLLIRHSIKFHRRGGQITHSWDAYMEATCKNSYGFRECINDDRTIWTLKFLNKFDKFTAKSRPNG